jgi:hypothetical protein
MFPRDADIRRCIDALRSSFARSIVTYTIIKRFALVLLFVGLVLAARWQGPPAWLPIAVTVATLGLFLALTSVLYFLYYYSLSVSANAVGTLIIRRINDLAHLQSDLQGEMSRQDMVRISQSDERWPPQAAFMVKLVIWTSKRMEYVENYLQIEMWRINRIQTWCRAIGTLVAFATLIAFAAVVLVPRLAGQVSLLGGAGSGPVIAMWVAALLGFAWSLFLFRTPPREIQTTLQKHILRLADTRLDKIIGELIEHDKSSAIGFFNKDRDIAKKSSKEHDD